MVYSLIKGYWALRGVVVVVVVVVAAEEVVVVVVVVVVVTAAAAAGGGVVVVVVLPCGPARPFRMRRERRGFTNVVAKLDATHRPPK